MPEVAIVYPYFRTRSPMEILLPPLGAAALVGQLHLLGVEWKIFDCTFTSLPRLIRALTAFQPGKGEPSGKPSRRRRAAADPVP